MAKISVLDEPSPSEKEELSAARAQAAASNFPVMAVSGIIGALFLVAILWNEVHRFYLISWATTIVLWNTYTIKWFAFGLDKTAPTNEWVKLLRKFEWAGLVAGFAWGTGIAFFIVNVDFTYQAFLFTLMVSVAAGSIHGISPSSRTATFFLCSLLLPTAGILLLHFDQFRIFLTVLILLLLSIFIRVAKANDLNISNRILLNIRNEVLAKQLSQANEQLRNANIAKTRFLASANHDLRQPMHALSLLVVALRDHPERSSSHEVQNIVHKIENSIDALNGLFNTVLDISKLDAETIKPDILTFPLWNIFESLEAHYGPLAAQKGIAFSVLRTQVLVKSDPSLLNRIIRNFVSNAIQYTEQGRVIVGVRRHELQIEIQVIDTGIGIPANQQDIIFQEFKQLGNPTHDRSLGLGLGLSIVQRLSNLLRHQVGVRSIPSEGSIFFIRVPCCGSITSTSKNKIPDSQLNKELIRNLYIVVVDDEEDILYAMEMILKGYGCRYICIPTVTKFLETVEEHIRQPDLIITDFRISDTENGYDVIRRIRESQESEIPALILTGSSEEADTIADANFIVLKKPVTEHQLLEGIINALSKSSIT